MSSSLSDAQNPPEHADMLAGLRRRMAMMSGRADQAAIDVADPSEAVLPVPEVLSELLPHRGIARGSVVSCDGARSLLLSLIASTTRAGGQVAIVGLPKLSLLSAVEMGADLSRIATVPVPGSDPVEVAAVLLDGMDLVVLDLSGVGVTPSRSRVVMGRVRKQSSVLMVTGGAWPGAQIRLDAAVVAYRHAPGRAAAGHLDVVGRGGSGYGRIGGMRMRVTACVRGGRRRDTEVDLLAARFGDRRVELVAVQDVSPVSSRRPELAVAN